MGTLVDVKDYMFLALETLSNPDLSPDELKAEISRARAMGDISSIIVETARTEIEAHKLVSKGSLTKEEHLNLVGVGKVRYIEGAENG